MKCPKCGSKAVEIKYVYAERRNVCLICGLSHCIGAAKESLDRQLRGTLWRNPRTAQATEVNP